MPQLPTVDAASALRMNPHLAKAIASDSGVQSLFTGVSAHVTVTVQYSAGSGPERVKVDRDAARALYGALFARDGSNRDNTLSETDLTALMATITDGRSKGGNYSAAEKALAKVIFEALDDRQSVEFMGREVKVPDPVEAQFRHAMLSFFGRMGGYATARVNAAKVRCTEACAWMNRSAN